MDAIDKINILNASIKAKQFLRNMENNKLNELEKSKGNPIDKNDFGTLAIDLGSSTTVVVFQKEIYQIRHR